MINILKQVLGQILNLALSVFIFRYYSKELWGEFSSYFLFIGITTVVISWGNKDFLIREFSKNPNKITYNFYLLFNTRLLLLVPSLLITLLVFPYTISCFFILWIVSAYISQSLEVFWVYKRDYYKSILIEIISFVFLIGFLCFFTITRNNLIAFYSYYQLIKALLYASIYYSELKNYHFNINKKYFYLTISFFVLSLVGFLQSRIDFIMITFFETNKNIAIYQIISTYFILIHALGTFLIFPYIKNIYRLEKKAVANFQKLISLISPIVVTLCLVFLFLIIHYVYLIELDIYYYLLGFLITFPPYLYTIKILMLYKVNKQHIVLHIGIKAIIINSCISFLLLYFGWGLKGALIGSAVAQFFTAYQYLIYFSNQNQSFKVEK